MKAERSRGVPSRGIVKPESHIPDHQFEMTEHDANRGLLIRRLSFYSCRLHLILCHPASGLCNPSGVSV